MLLQVVNYDKYQIRYLNMPIAIAHYRSGQNLKELVDIEALCKRVWVSMSSSKEIMKAEDICGVRSATPDSELEEGMFWVYFFYVDRGQDFKKRLESEFKRYEDLFKTLLCPCPPENWFEDPIWSVANA